MERFRPRFRNRFNNRNRSNTRKKAGFQFNESMFIKKVEELDSAIKKVYTPNFLFKDLEVNNQLKQNILIKKYIEPTEIQSETILHILQGKDLLGIANTGTGKTAAFLIPLIDKVYKNKNSKVLIITPTRELAEQIKDELYLLSKSMGIYSVLCIGGAKISMQIYNLRRGYNFVIGTPGRIKDLFNKKVLNLGGFNTIVLDEVDRMLDMGFVHEIKHIISFLPSEKHSLCFSATVDKKVEEIIKTLLKENFIKISVKTGETARNIEQDIVRVNNRQDKLNKLAEYLNSNLYEKVLVFANTKREVDTIEKNLYGKGIRVESIHGDKRQNERKRALSNFKIGKAKALIATDVAARGLDISNISHVINYDIPLNYEDYIHRVGRTGRADKKGKALTFVENKKVI